MKKIYQRVKALLFTGIILSSMVGCAANKETVALQPSTTQGSEQGIEQATAQTIAPKYIFLFIGDGMSYPQIQTAAYYKGTNASNGSIETQKLSFMDFPVTGSAQTYDSTSFCPDSASTATSIATGNKTYSGTINMDTSMTTAFETITEQLKAQKEYKIGIISSVNLNHATPSAFYAHQPSRGNYYEIGEELVASGFDFFAGGALLKPTGSDEDKKDLYEVASEAGYKVVKTQAEAKELTQADGKMILISEKLADADAMNYDIDSASDEWKLADYVEKGIEVLDNETGFFMMVEGGKIDWAGHANDAGSSISDTIAMDEAVKKAIAFYEEKPEETLIIVTGDHETGGLTIGFAGTNYDTYMTNLANQKISYAKFDTDYVAGYKENKTPFADALKDVKKCFGLMAADDADATEESKLVLTDYEYKTLEKAYKRTLEIGSAEQEEMTQDEYVLYGTYEPFTVTVTHILNNKSGISYSSYSHTGLPVPVFALGKGASLFEGYYDNTDIYHRIAQLAEISK